MQGKLVHASIGIPVDKGLLSQIYTATKNDPPFVTIMPHIKQCLKDWKQKLIHLHLYPTSVLELVPGTASHIGHVDSS